MKFVHIADMHFDSPFTSLSRIEGLSDTRRLEQRKVFKNIIEYINENNVNIKNLIKDKEKLKKIIKQLKELKVSYRSMEKILNISRETLRRNG